MGLPLRGLAPEKLKTDARKVLGCMLARACEGRAVPGDKEENMTFTEAAAEVLRQKGKPLHYKEITELAIEKNLLSHVGKSPEVTMGQRLAALLKKEDKTNPIVRVRPGVFALREWGKKKRAEAASDVESPEEETEVNALELEERLREADEAGEPDGEEGAGAGETPLDDDDAFRADLAASGAELFDDEEDDDQPILAPPASQAQLGGPTSPTGEPSGDGRRGRRRRRRRGRGRDGDFAESRGQDRGSSAHLDARSEAASAEGEPVDTARDPMLPAPRPQVRERQQIMAGGSPRGIEIPLAEGDELFGRELSDAAHLVMSTFDRNAGPVPARTVVDALMRRGRLQGDPQIASGQLLASLRADNLRRSADGQRVRFRLTSGSRVALTDWLLGGDLPRFEQEAMQAVERYREAARRVFLRRVQELPGHAFVELALLTLEKLGMGGMKIVRRPGASGGEAHFAGTHRTAGMEIPTAIVIRKDGREIGREKVTDLRGAFHHYENAKAGVIITTGQVLSGAREETQADADPVTLFDGFGFARLMEEARVGALEARVTLMLPDVEFFEALRGT